LSFGFRQAGHNLVLEFLGKREGFSEGVFALGSDDDLVGAAVLSVGGSADEVFGFHAVEDRGDGVGIAGHQVGDLSLGQADAFGLAQPAEDCVVVGGDSKVGDTAAECLVEAVPTPAHQRREPKIDSVAIRIWR